MCKDTRHICHRCKKEVVCNLADWICPWVNDDEDDMCASCMLLTEMEMVEFEEEHEADLAAGLDLLRSRLIVIGGDKSKPTV